MHEFPECQRLLQAEFRPRTVDFANPLLDRRDHEERSAVACLEQAVGGSLTAGIRHPGDAWKSETRHGVGVEAPRHPVGQSVLRLQTDARMLTIVGSPRRLVRELVVIAKLPPIDRKSTRLNS